MSSIWEACKDQVQPSLVGGDLFRIVEDQEQIATRQLVDGDLERLEVLEQLLESTKPPRVPGTEDLHYLLATPWRYPPLRHGSRFGRRHEPSLFYGGKSLECTLAEGAYYRFVFRLDMESPPEKPAIASQHTVYQARYRSESGVRLQNEPFDRYRAELTHPVSYSATQLLGTALRTAGIEAIEYRSARDPSQEGINIALLHPAALTSKAPTNLVRWLCSTGADTVVFRSASESSAIHKFDLQSFLIDGAFPSPA